MQHTNQKMYYTNLQDAKEHFFLNIHILINSSLTLTDATQVLRPCWTYAIDSQVFTNKQWIWGKKLPTSLSKT